MTKPLVVTSFSLEGYETYGKVFVESFNEYMSKLYRLEVFSEDDLPIEHTKLTDDRLYSIFLDVASLYESTKDTTDYRWQASRFCHKVFAIYNAWLYSGCTVLWFDADTEFFSTPMSHALEYMTVAGGVSFLARPINFRHTDTSFISFSSCAKTPALWYKFYTTRALFSLNEWHDCIAFDIARLLSEDKMFNIAYKVNEKHPWPHTVLGTFSKNYKGPGRKLERYGKDITGAVYREIKA